MVPSVNVRHHLQLLVVTCRLCGKFTVDIVIAKRSACHIIVIFITVNKMLDTMVDQYFGMVCQKTVVKQTL